MNFCRWFEEIAYGDIPLVGGKNASLGQMMKGMGKSIPIPNGFAITTDAYRAFINHNQLQSDIDTHLVRIGDGQNMEVLSREAAAIRTLFVSGIIPQEIIIEIEKFYTKLSTQYTTTAVDVAVRSSATAEDLPNASFAGQQDTFLNIVGTQALYDACKHSWASLFTDRAIVYRMHHQIPERTAALSIGVQKMVRADRGSSGVAFSLDPDSGARSVIVINSSWGLGEAIVQGLVTPDEYMVHKAMLVKGYDAIVKRQKGKKTIKFIYNPDNADSIKQVSCSAAEQQGWSLTDEQVCTLARLVVSIEEYYSQLHGTYQGMDIEWAYDGYVQELFIVQARPETVHSHEKRNVYTRYHLKEIPQKSLLTGSAIGQKISSGIVRMIADVSELSMVQKGEVVVAQMTDPDWVPALRIAAGVITQRGGRTCHAAIVSRELGIPAIVGVDQAFAQLHTGMMVTLDCSRGTTGYIYEGAQPYDTETVHIDDITTPPVPIYVNCASSDGALALSLLPTAGVGLARIEFIISTYIKVHPLALLYPEKVTDHHVNQAIALLTADYAEKKQFFVDQLARNIALIAGAFYPRPVIVRFSDFKTNEYRNLIGGQYFEPIEENPMLGLRGASRYYHAQYTAAFALECAAINYARTTMGFDNVAVMIPFVRTVVEIEKVTTLMKTYGLLRGKQGLEVIMMCELPSNVLLIEQFAQHVDGFSIGSNDLTQLTLGVDRDSPDVASLFDEQDSAIKELLVQAIKRARAHNRPIGICGQGPSDFPDFARFLISNGITYLSLNGDAVIHMLEELRN